MRGAPRKLTSEEHLYAAAVRALMRRAHSVFEMRRALERRAEEPSLVHRVLDRLKAEKLLDDARYSRQFARYHAETRRQGKFRIARDLRARGVTDRHIESALEEIFSETDESALIRKRIARRLKSLRGGAADLQDRRKLASLYRSLLRAGFSADVIRTELRAATRQDTAELPEPQEEDSGD